MMPSGVEHRFRRAALASCTPALPSMMPSGVEHIPYYGRTITIDVGALPSMMPSGVEHASEPRRKRLSVGVRYLL